MSKVLNEIGKLRNEMKVGFIELENQMKSDTDRMLNTMNRFSKKVDKAFIVIEGVLDKDRM